MCVDGVLARCWALGRAPDLCGFSQGSLGNSGGGPQKRVHMAEGKGQAKKGRGAGLVYLGGYGEVTGSSAPCYPQPPGPLHSPWVHWSQK